MDVLSVNLKPERRAALVEYAERHGKDVETAVDDLLAAQLEREQRDYDETVEAILEAYEDVKTGRTRPAEEVYESLRVKHGLPR
jgi:hypothetical protein